MWTRAAGHYYFGASYSHISAQSMFDVDFQVRPGLAPYEQHVLGIYGELGIINDLLTGSIEWQAYRNASYEKLTSFSGSGDLRVGIWSGLLKVPFRITLGLLIGFPTGDANPVGSSPKASDAEKPYLALLPTGDGEWDVEARLGLGHSFGGKRRYPVRHYLAVELGYWMRSNHFSDAVTWKVELGTQLPWKFVDRFWIIWHFTGLESFTRQVSEVTRSPTGIGNGVTWLSPGFDLYGRVYKGWGAQFGLDSALRGRAVPAAIQLRVGISYQY